MGGVSIDFIGPEDTDWLIAAQADGLTWLKVDREFPTKYICRPAREDEIEEAGIDVSQIPKGAVIYALVFNSGGGRSLCVSEHRFINLVAVEPSMVQRVEGLNAGGVYNLYVRSAPAPSKFHLARSRSFRGGMRVQAPPPQGS